jgi:hypothetical protein
MNIELPDKFFYSSADRKARAYVKEGILFVEGHINFEDLMYSLAYTLKGYDKCYYCGRDLGTYQRTIDHLYPRTWGGVSIPNNLVPCCSRCNREKDCMTEQQYRVYLRCKNRSVKDTIAVKFAIQNRKKCRDSFVLPRSWYEDYRVDRVADDIDFSFLSRKAIRETTSYYKRHRHYKQPLVVSSNDWVFDGMRVLYHAKCHGIEVVPAIILDNVVKIHV